MNNIPISLYFWDDKGQVRVIGGKLLPYELNHSPTDACQSLQLPH